MLFDCHAHLDLLEEEALKEVLERADASGVAKIISCATSFSSNEKNLSLAQQYKQILPALGLCPLDALELNDVELEKAFAFFEENVRKGVAIGEVGMDYKYAKSDAEKEKQKNVFERFIALATREDKPLIVHSRFAQKQVLDLLIAQNAKKVLLHTFVDSQKLMALAAEKGFFVSVGLSVLHNEEVQKNIAVFPLENLLFETDAPVRFSGREAEPGDVKELAEKVAELKEITFLEVQAAQEKNYKALFKP